ncbi:MAG: hypothetical protein ACREQM_05530 [Candidatus Dormibacteraceae bacterium]
MADDEAQGIAWWNDLPESERLRWLQRARNRVITEAAPLGGAPMLRGIMRDPYPPTPAEAWAAFKRSR